MSWEEEVAGLIERMETAHSAREEALKKCRSLIQTSAKCIRHVHRRQFDEARGLLDQAKTISLETRSSLADHPQLLYAGYVQDAEKEMVEAAAVLSWIGDDRDPPTRGQLGVELSSYLNGLGEAASETRRYVLDELRQGRLDEATRLLRRMETVYDDLTTFDFPDALTGGLRRTCDALRAVIERTRSDVTMTQVQYELMSELRRRH